ncbi:uncharacterized protein A4U43_C01F110 [Asparagus officinalis]|uniref:Uncharacterized protein n=1 Tax=Asparagus officinalis TaxID=4686 RepID=A0A5P1FQA1_ASPOF|nr:uncharacterized protein A4U43_C01F110 [Asparagus officinalis]
MTEQMVCLDGALAFWHIGIVGGGCKADPKRESRRFEEGDGGPVLWHAADHKALEELGDGAMQPWSLEEEGHRGREQMKVGHEWGTVTATAPALSL